MALHITALYDNSGVTMQLMEATSHLVTELTLNESFVGDVAAWRLSVEGRDSCHFFTWAWNGCLGELMGG